MKKFAFVLGLAGLISSPAFAVDYTVGGVLAADNNATQNVTVNPVSTTTGVVFTVFTMTVSKGVSISTAEDTTNNVIAVGAKHYSSKVVVGGITGGGSVAPCATDQERNVDVTAPTIDGATGVCS